MHKNLGFFEAKTVEKVKGGINIRIRLMSAGQGSSGFYPESMLENAGPNAFPKGTKLFYNHPSEQERESHRDVRLIFGKTISDAEYVPEEKALYATAHVFEKDADFIQQIMEDVDLSIEAAGELDEDDNVVLEYHPTNAVALVPVGGRDGKITSLIESHISADNKVYGIMENVDTPTPKDYPDMTKEEMLALIKESLAEFKSELVEALTPEPKNEEAADVKDIIKALNEADLPEAAVDAVLGSESPLDAIETFKAVKTAVIESVKAPKVEEVNGVRITESDKTPAGRKTVGAWN